MKIDSLVKTVNLLVQVATSVLNDDRGDMRNTSEFPKFSLNGRGALTFSVLNRDEHAKARSYQKTTRWQDSEDPLGWALIIGAHVIFKCMGQSRKA